MLIRIVKMRFRADSIADFRAHFEAHKSQIRGFEGCQYLQVLQQADDAQVWFTHSHWRSEADLQAYRQSELFRGVWAATKQWFDARPEAWTLEEQYLLP
jgi:autoinducer 2-degrading protein